VLKVSGLGGGEGRLPSLMIAAVESRASNYAFVASLMCRPWGLRHKRELSEVCINAKGISPRVAASAGRGRAPTNSRPRRGRTLQVASRPRRGRDLEVASRTRRSRDLRSGSQTQALSVTPRGLQTRARSGPSSGTPDLGDFLRAS
jgi:hypothetical protein